MSSPTTEPTDEGAPDTGRVVLAKTYAGDDLNGTATGHALMTRGDKGASYVAQERIVGTLRGHWGSFVLEHGASMGEGQETVMRAVIVAGSGTGALAGISGTGHGRARAADPGGGRFPAGEAVPTLSWAVEPVDETITAAAPNARAGRLPQEVSC